MRINKLSLKLIIAVVALLLVAAACGDSAATTTTQAPVATSAAATTTVPAETTTTAPAETTTTAPAETTTTAAETTTTTAGGSTDADARAMAKTDAVLAIVPDGWTGAIDEGPQENADTDFVFGPCVPEGGFDLATLDDVSLAVSQVEVMGPPNPPFSAPLASIEARVFESESTALDAFVVLELVLGTEEGRQCFADNVGTVLAESAPPGTEFEVRAEDLGVAGADVSSRVTLSFDAGGITAAIYFDFVAGLQGDCTVLATFLSFVEPFPADGQEALFGAAMGAA